MARAGPGPLALIGGDELKPGNEPQDRMLVEAAGTGPAFVLATAAGRQHPEQAVANAVRWFGTLGLEVRELPATRRSDATAAANVERARAGGFFYLVGGRSRARSQDAGRHTPVGGDRRGVERRGRPGGLLGGRHGVRRVDARPRADARRRPPPLPAGASARPGDRGVAALRDLRAPVGGERDRRGSPRGRRPASASTNGPPRSITGADGVAWGAARGHRHRGKRRRTFGSGEEIEGLPAPDPSTP